MRVRNFDKCMKNKKKSKSRGAKRRGEPVQAMALVPTKTRKGRSKPPLFVSKSVIRVMAVAGVLYASGVAAHKRSGIAVCAVSGVDVIPAGTFGAISRTDAGACRTVAGTGITAAADFGGRFRFAASVEKLKKAGKRPRLFLFAEIRSCPLS